MPQLTFDKCQLWRTLIKSHEKQLVLVDLFNFYKVPELMLKRLYDGRLTQ